MSNYDAGNILQSNEYRQELAIQKSFMARVYGWMTIGLLITALTALMIAGSPALVKTLFQTGAIWILIIAELAVAFTFTLALGKLPVPVAAVLFLAYSALTGATFALILMVYTFSSVAGTFFITAGMFGGMSVFGFVTGKSLDGLGSFCSMGLIGLLIAMVVNIFIGSSAMQWLISVVGVIVFTGLTAYDTQKIKQAYATGGSGSAMNQKAALFGAFQLYLDFINLFLFLIQLFGKRRD